MNYYLGSSYCCTTAESRVAASGDSESATDYQSDSDAARLRLNILPSATTNRKAHLRHSGLEARRRLPTKHAPEAKTVATRRAETTRRRRRFSQNRAESERCFCVRERDRERDREREREKEREKERERGRERRRERLRAKGKGKNGGREGGTERSFGIRKHLRTRGAAGAPRG